MSVLDDVGAESAKLTLRNHPYIVIFVFSVCWVFFGIGAFLANKTFAEKAVEKQVVNLSADLSGLKTQLIRSDLEASIRSLDTEIYQLQRLADSGNANSRDLNRLDSLKSEQRQKERELSRLDE